MTRLTHYLVTSVGLWSDAGHWTLHNRKVEALDLAKNMKGGSPKVYRRTINLKTGAETLRLIWSRRMEAA